MEILSLKHEKKFVPIRSRDKLYYGGDQAWLSTSVQRHGCCGTVAAANLTAYRMLYKEEGEEAGDAQIQSELFYNKEEFISHMDELYRYVKPLKLPFLSENIPPFKGFGWVLGVWPAKRLIRGVMRYGKAVGESYAPVCYKKKQEEPEQFIAEALKKDQPVALLIGSAKYLKLIPVHMPDGSSYLQTDFSLHWVIITALFRNTETGQARIRVSTWGGSAWLELSECLHTGFIKSRMCYFQ